VAVVGLVPPKQSLDGAPLSVPLSVPVSVPVPVARIGFGAKEKPAGLAPAGAVFSD
jgi:hypothetical protein